MIIAPPTPPPKIINQNRILDQATMKMEAAAMEFGREDG
jgi:hypothetical protein